MMRFAKTILVAMLTAIGLRNAACVLLSNNIGVSPSAVVEVVRKIAWNRRRADSTTASVGVIWQFDEIGCICLPGLPNH